MNATKHIAPAIVMTLALTVLLGLLYPLVVTGFAVLLFPARAHGSLVERHGKVAGSSLIGQTFSRPGYFRSRPSAAGSGYDPMNSGGSNLGPTSKKLIEENLAAAAKTAQAENPGAPIPVDLVTASGSGLDPHISPAAAAFQVPRVARERRMGEREVRQLVAQHTEGRQLGFLGEPRVNVLELNLALDDLGAGVPK